VINALFQTKSHLNLVEKQSINMSRGPLMWMYLLVFH